jgi:tRNA-2-methylthio-N6-dimethylallyladenosine synthase
MKYYLWTIGCQMNFADSRQAAEELDRLGFHQADRPEEADLILLNTCVVRQSAEDKVIGRLTSLQGLRRRKPSLRLALVGCFVNDVPALQLRYPWVDAFIQPSDVGAVVQFALRAAAGKAQAEKEELPPAGAPASPLGSPLAVAVGVPINYGCDHLCTYCVVRLRRGPEVSRPLQEIVSQVQGLAARGVREVTLLGQNVDSYGHDLPPLTVGQQSPPDLASLLQAIHAIEGLHRIRFLTSHPADMTGRLIDTAARLPKVCEHIELPVQSGDDAILRRMGRGYTVAQYLELVACVRQAMPGVGLATDVIVGFPGETEAQFEATYHLLKELRFDMVHVAAYSPRPGTAAERLADDVPAGEKERRRRAVDTLQERIIGEINARLLGHTVEVLVEERHRGRWRGRTRTNKLVFFDVDATDWAGELVLVRIIRSGPWSLQGELALAPTAISRQEGSTIP